MVYEIKKTNPDLEIIINGGITTTEQIKKHLNYFNYFFYLCMKYY